MWLVGLIHLVFLFHRTRQSAATQQLRERLREKGAAPELYTFTKFTKPCAVYIELKFPKLNEAGYAQTSRDASFCYVGSTNITVAKREYNRVAKLRQLQNLKLPEIAIRYWRDANNYKQFSTVLLSQHEEYIDAWAEEHCLIQHWQPKLNYPFVTKELVKKAHGLVPKKQQPHIQRPPDTIGKQLFKKLRRRVQGQNRRLINILIKHAQFWKLLYAISSDTKQKYDASRELRSGKHGNETVTLLFRLANHMEQPWRSKARARLRLVLQFRNASVPKFNLPIKIPFWAHPSHKANVKKFLGDLIRKHIKTLIPYHLPTKTVQELPHPSLTKVLWNHKRKVTDLGRHWRQQECSCIKFAKQHPRAQLHEGHIATGMETLSMPPSLAILSNVGGSNAFFPSKRRLQEQFMDSFRRWITHHQFPRDQRILDEFQELCQQEWTLHTKQLQQEPRLTHKIIKHIISLPPDEYIVHNEDHANAHLMVCCPNIYNNAAYNTWMGKATLHLLDKTPHQIKVEMRHNKPKQVSKHYSKLLSLDKPLPYGYIMMKRKKSWRNGRTIIAYANTCVGKLLKVTALALQQLLNVTWPSHFGNVSTPELWSEIHHFLSSNEQMHPDRHL